MKLTIYITLLFIVFSWAIYGQQNDTIKAREFEKRAKEFFDSYKYDSAANYYLKAANIYIKKNEWLNSARNYRLAASSFHQSSTPDTALYYARKSLSIITSNTLENTPIGAFEMVEIYEKLGIFYNYKGKYSKALSYLKKGLEVNVFNDTLNLRKKMKIWHFKGFVYKNLNNYDTALKYCLKSIEYQKKLPASFNEAFYPNMRLLGLIFYAKGDYSKAIKYLKKSFNVLYDTDRPNHPLFADHYNDLGASYTKMGNYDKALEYFQKAINILQISLGEYNPRLSFFYNNIGVINYFKGDYISALKNYKKALNIDIKAYGQEHIRIAMYYVNIGLMYYMENNYDSALSFYQKALKLRIKELGENNYRISNIYNNIGGVLIDKKNYEEALVYHKKALKILMKIFGKKHPYVARTYYYLGIDYKEMANYKKALQNFQLSLISNLPSFDDSIVSNNPKILNALSNPFFLETLHDKGVTLYQKYKKDSTIQDIKASIATFDLGFALIQKMRTGYSNESTQLMLSENTKNFYTDALFIVSKNWKIPTDIRNKEKPFEYIEKSKSATLSAYLSGIAIKSYINISQELSIKEKELIINRHSFETKIQKAKSQKGGYDTTLVQNYQDKLFNYSRQYDSLINIYKENYPDYYQLKYEQNVANINDVQNQLGEKGALLNYFVGDTTLFIAAVNKDTLVYKTITIDSSFTQQIIDYHIDIKSGFGKKEIKSSNQLYGYLLKPIEDIITDKERLVIIPDEYLNYVPFETLCKDTDLSQPGYLIKDYAVNYHYSVTLWLNSKKKAEKNTIAGNNFIGFAPVFDPKVNNGYILSSEWFSDTTDVEVATRSVSSDLKNFNALPYSEKEIKAILKLFKKKGGKADGYFYKEATEKSFKEKAAGYKYVHIASHSFTNDNYPALSGIAFSQPDTTGFNGSKNEDGILYAGESYNLNLAKAELVVLSSCKSGLGKLVKGEGFLSLSRGFLYAGTPNIVFSLWNVKDQATKDLMVEFYKQLLNGKTYADALRMAKLKLIKSSKTKEPKYWGAWVLVGE